MSTPRQQWLLKVIAGPHQGAEIGLHAGKTLIGSDDECDVVLHDVLIAPQHVELELSATGMVAAPLGGRVYINGKRVRDSRQALPDFGFLSIGGTHLVIGPAEGKWPLLSAADVPELEKEAETAADDKSADADKATTNAEAKPADAATPVAPSVTPPAPPAPAAAGSKLGPILGITAGLLLLIGWAVVYHDFFGHIKTEEEEIAERKPVERAQAVVEDLGLTDTVKVEEVAGRVTASGYVDTENRQRELQAVFRATVPGMRTKIYSLEKIASSARALIEDQHLPLTVSSLTEGKLKVTGKLASGEPWVRMRQSLLREVPGLSGIEDGVEIEAPRPNTPNVTYIAVAATPPAASPAAPAKPVPQAPVAVATPPPAPSLPAGPPPILNQFASVPQPDPVTDYLVTQDTIDTPESTISAIRSSTDGLGFVRLSTGGVYFSGARFPYGGTLTKIEPESVVIIEKGETRTLKQGDFAMKPKPAAAKP